MLNPIDLAFGVCLGVWIGKGGEGKFFISNFINKRNKKID